MSQEVVKLGGSGTSRVERRPSLSVEMLRRAAGKDWKPEQVNAAAKMLNDQKLVFPPGKRRVSPGLVEILHRVRIHVAALIALSEHGWQDATIDHVEEISGHPRRVIYTYYKDRDELFLEAIDSVADCLRARIEKSASRGNGWRERFSFGLEEMLRFANDEAYAARALVVDAHAAGIEGQGIHHNLLEHFAHCMEKQTRKARGGNVPPTMSQALVGSVDSLLHLRLSQGKPIEREELLRTVTSLADSLYGTST